MRTGPTESLPLILKLVPFRVLEYSRLISHRLQRFSIRVTGDTEIGGSHSGLWLRSIPCEPSCQDKGQYCAGQRPERDMRGDPHIGRLHFASPIPKDPAIKQAFP